MKQMMFLLALAGAIAVPAQAQNISATQTEIMKQLIATYAEKAKADAAKAKGKPAQAEVFSPENGRQIYLMSRNWEGDAMPACAACHTDDPKQEGKHNLSKKPIMPLAPVANPERFTDVNKVEKNFSNHCRDIYSRDCTAAEKGHFLTYLMSVK
jgi:mono/diheme cytochrome c family protein